jgi:hypothetical protein
MQPVVTPTRSAFLAPPDVTTRQHNSLLDLDILPELPPEPGMFQVHEPGRLAKLLDRFTGSYTDWQAARDAHLVSVQEYNDFLNAVRDAMNQQHADIYVACNTRTISVCPVAGKGGAAKTTTATNLAAAFAIGSQRPTVLYDGNPDFGGSAARSNVDVTSTLTLSQFYELFRTENFAELSARMQPSTHGVYVVAADSDEIARKITPEQTLEMLDALKRYFRVLVIDLGTGVSSPVNYVVHKFVDVFVYPMLTTSGVNTVNGAVDGRISTQKRLVTQSMDDLDDPDNIVALKANYGLTLAIGARYGEDLNEFRQRIGTDNKLLAVPWDAPSQQMQPVRLPTYNTPLVGPGMSSPATAVAWSKAAIQCYRLADEIKELIRNRQNSH